MFRNGLSRLVGRHVARSSAAAATSMRPVVTRSMATTGGAALAELKTATPHMDVVRYEHKNRTWTLNHVDYYSTAVAIGLIDAGLQPSDVVLSWLPAHFSEQVRIKRRCFRR